MIATCRAYHLFIKFSNFVIHYIDMCLVVREELEREKKNLQDISDQHSITSKIQNLEKVNNLHNMSSSD